jgi:hypothetical protein
VLVDTSEVLLLDPGNLKALYRRSLACEATHDLYSAITAVDEILRTQPDNELTLEVRKRLTATTSTTVASAPPFTSSIPSTLWERALTSQKCYLCLSTSPYTALRCGSCRNILLELDIPLRLDTLVEGGVSTLVQAACGPIKEISRKRSGFQGGLFCADDKNCEEEETTPKRLRISMQMGSDDIPLLFSERMILLKSNLKDLSLDIVHFRSLYKQDGMTFFEAICLDMHKIVDYSYIMPETGTDIAVSVINYLESLYNRGNVLTLVRKHGEMDSVMSSFSIISNFNDALVMMATHTLYRINLTVVLEGYKNPIRLVDNFDSKDIVIAGFRNVFFSFMNTAQSCNPRKATSIRMQILTEEENLKVDNQLAHGYRSAIVSNR